MAEVRELRDVYGRRYRVGESDRELLGRPRTWVTWLAAAAEVSAWPWRNRPPNGSARDRDHPGHRQVRNR